MHNKTIYSFVVLLLMFWPVYSFAVCPDPNTITTVPILADVEVNASVVLDPKTRIYSYSYRLKDGSKSTGCLWSFEIDIVKPIGSITLPTEGLVSYVPSLDSRNADSPPMIPVAFPSVPMMGEHPTWNAGTSVYGTASWGSNRYTYQIEPGSTLSGFIMTTYGLPAIRDFKVEPKYIAEDEDIFNMGVSRKEYRKNHWKYLNAFYESIAWKGKTIGPTAPPIDFKPADFIDYLINLKHQAVSLGWIKNEGIVNSLDVKLDNAKKKLSDGSPGAAKNILNAFINEVEAQGCATYENCPPGKHLTSEAYALLKYNAQYLIDNLSK